MVVKLHDVARLAGVSVGTVSNVLNNPTKVAPSTAERVRSAIEQLGFVPNGAARQLRAGESRSVGMIVLDISNPFFTDVVQGVEARAAANNVSVLLANSGEDKSRESIHLRLFEEQRVRGVLITPVGEVNSELERLRSRGIPSVLVDRHSASPQWSSVSVDDVAGGRMAVEHLLQLGRRRILFVGGPLHLTQVRDRLDGARQAARAVPGSRIDVLPVAGLSMRHGVMAGRDITSLSLRPDAIFAANDLIALGMLDALAVFGEGLNVPDDVAIVGYDDIAFAAAAAVPITSIRQPRDDIGRRAFELLEAEIDNSADTQQLVFKPELIVRSSSVSGKAEPQQPPLRTVGVA